MMNIFFRALVVALAVSSCNIKKDKTPKQSNKEKFEANWESLKKYEVPEWFQDAKLGIFIHWGPYSVPEFGSEWYPRWMYMSEKTYSPSGEIEKEGPNWVYNHHVKKYGGPEKFGYKDFIPEFKAEKFDAKEWISLFKASGAKYIVPVAEHHDGFAMYQSSLTRWNAVDMGPKKDVLGLLSKEAHRQGLKIGASSHYAFNWNYFTHKEGFDTSDPQYADLYARPHDFYAPADKEFLEMWWARTKEIIDRYEPDVLWFDFYMDRPEFTAYHPKLAAYYYNKGIDWGKDVVLQSKNFDMVTFPEGTNVYDLERGKMADIRKLPWQTDTSIGKNSWCHVENWESKTPNTIIDDLIDIVSKNGCLLLNVGPKADGTIPEDQVAVLRELGSWLKINGEAIYGSRPWKMFGEGPTHVATGHHTEGTNEELTAKDFRFTSKDGLLYAIAMDWPEDRQVLIPALKIGAEHLSSAVKSVSLLGTQKKVDWKQTEEGLMIQLPEMEPMQYAITFKIQTEDKVLAFNQF
ncbi:alpha-L-fucosidase [Persicobacter psychrovividus]|uniref:alpha-L-fucosidase n=1 Tax=Persicobacter psychrovividus TaxID=387638 RepID=A0ABN6LHA4_9BACT|nr:alpha-L-fucosidase [Persicobacter psychrovividus]